MLGVTIVVSVVGGTPVVLLLQLFFMATARTVVNHDDVGGTAPDAVVWSAGSLPKKRGIVKTEHLVVCTERVTQTHIFSRVAHV